MIEPAHTVTPLKRTRKKNVPYFAAFILNLSTCCHKFKLKFQVEAGDLVLLVFGIILLPRELLWHQVALANKDRMNAS